MDVGVIVAAAPVGIAVSVGMSVTAGAQETKTIAKARLQSALLFSLDALISKGTAQRLR
jgi:hypothetical protein